MKDFITKLLSDNKGIPSSKRFNGTLWFTLGCIAALIYSFVNKDPSLIKFVITLGAWLLGFGIFDNISNNNLTKNNNGNVDSSSI